jgi:hypothetical protein
MLKLPTREIIDSIAAIEDSILLAWKYQCNPDEPVKVLKRGYLPPLRNRQGTLQVLHTVFDMSEDPKFKRRFAEVMEDKANESQG